MPSQNTILVDDSHLSVGPCFRSFEVKPSRGPDDEMRIQIVASSARRDESGRERPAPSTLTIEIDQKAALELADEICALLKSLPT
jgi:hypothetical protein